MLDPPVKDPWFQSPRSFTVGFLPFLFILISKDLRKAVESLHKLGNEFKIIHTGQKRVICSVSIELSQDNMTILQAAE
jgi:hypothetical protein